MKSAVSAIRTEYGVFDYGIPTEVDCQIPPCSGRESAVAACETPASSKNLANEKEKADKGAIDNYLQSTETPESTEH